MTREDDELVEACARSPMPSWPNTDASAGGSRCWSGGASSPRPRRLIAYGRSPPPTRSCALSVMIASKPSSMKHLQVPTSGPCIRRSHETQRQRQAPAVRARRPRNDELARVARNISRRALALYASQAPVELQAEEQRPHLPAAA